MSSSIRWAALVIVLALAADLAVVANLELPWRGLAVFAFLLLGPGLPYVRVLVLPSVATELTLAMALSLALDTAVAEVMILAQVWSAGTALAVLIFMAVAGVFIDLVRATRRKGTVAS
ncbi:MAG: hypothetical protein ACYC3S_08915 [Chloroflexota bacterium]